MIRSLYTGASGMRAQQYKMDSIGNNIANISTTGYKSTKLDFKDTLYDRIRERSGENRNNLFVGNGVRIGSVQTYFTQGALEPTNLNLNIALEGDGFFALISPDGEHLYTRDGNFKLSYFPDNRARLDSGEGYPVLDQYGQPFIFDGDTNENDIHINIDGSVYLRDQHGSIHYQGELGIYTFTDMNGLEPAMNSYYTATELSGDPIGVSDARVIQGHLERSNVEISREMTELIIAQRAYQLNSRVVQTADEMEKQTNNLRG